MHVRYCISYALNVKNMEIVSFSLHCVPLSIILYKGRIKYVR